VLIIQRKYEEHYVVPVNLAYLVNWLCDCDW